MTIIMTTWSYAMAAINLYCVRPKGQSIDAAIHLPGERSRES